VEEFLTEAFSHVNLDWHDYVQLDPKYLRPAEVDLLIGDASKAKNELGWSPKVTFKELVRLMVEADMSTINRSEHEVFGDTEAAQSTTFVRS
jgi:GDPmannose 4,6-dehydratase